MSAPFPVIGGGAGIVVGGKIVVAAIWAAGDACEVDAIGVVGGSISGVGGLVIDRLLGVVSSSNAARPMGPSVTGVRTISWCSPYEYPSSVSCHQPKPCVLLAGMRFAQFVHHSPVESGSVIAN